MASFIGKQDFFPDSAEGAFEGEDSTTYCFDLGRRAYQGAPARSIEDFVLEEGKTVPEEEQLRPISIHEQRMRQLEAAVRSTCFHYFKTQYEEGYWWSELESNTSITSEYIMLLHILGHLEPDRQKKMVKYLLNSQRDDGSWGLYYGDGGDLSTTIEAYFALKLVGEDPDSEPLRKAREYILKKGGIEAARVFTKIWLALFSQYDWNKIPSMPVELVLLPSSFYFSIYEFSSWARGTVVPLSIVLTIRPRLKLPDSKTVTELYLPGAVSEKRFPSHTHKLFYLIDRMVKWFEQRPLPSLRNRAVQAAEDWVVNHQEESGDWGGIQPAMVYSVLALYYLGYPLDHQVMAKGLKALEDFCIEDERGLRLQSCISPVWDTALTALALLDAGVPPSHPALRKSAEWLMKNQITTGGDWQEKNCCLPGGWAFEFVNTRYPDVDDSAVVLMALHRLKACGCEGIDCVNSRGLDWCLSMECTEGGWAAFDKDNTMTILNRIPFADHEAMVDYPTADVSARVLEAMGVLGCDRSHRSAQRGVKFLRDLQEPDGCWWGRWGVNYIYGTWSVLRGLAAMGEDPKSPYIQAALKWLKERQNPDGGWGETCESYRIPELRGKGPSTASQTAWALMGLMAGGEARSPEVRRGVEYLLRTQQPDGTWEEEYFTGTGFPSHFYIRYHNYRNCFPLMALGQYLHKSKE